MFNWHIITGEYPPDIGGVGNYTQRVAQLLAECGGRCQCLGTRQARRFLRPIRRQSLLIQPYPDGISTRRSSAMAAISHGRPVLTISGHLTEQLWGDIAAVAMIPVQESHQMASTAKCLLANPCELQRLGLAGAQLYDDRFDLRHAITALRAIDM